MAEFFGDRLEKALAKVGMSQVEFARAVERTAPTVNGWVNDHHMPSVEMLPKICKVLHCSLDELLGLRNTSPDHHQEYGISWYEHIPAYFTGRYLDNIKLGIKWFRAVVKDGLDEQQCCAPDSRFPKHDWATLNDAFLVALRSGALRVTAVDRDEDLETKLCVLYPHLKKVVVAAIPHLEDGTYAVKAATVQTELVAFLAARKALMMKSLRGRPIGIGGGYTILRVAEQSTPSLDMFVDTQWIPLQVSANPALDIPDLTAQYNAALLASRHRGSKTIPLPFLPPKQQTNLIVGGPDQSYAEQCAADAMSMLKNTKTVIMSLTGDNLASSAVSTGFLSKVLQSHYDNLIEQGLIEEYAGIILGWLLNHRGKEFGGDAIRHAIYSPKLSVIKKIVRHGTVWVVAAGQYKARAVRMAISSGYANALVIDATIAERLLQKA